MSEGIIYEVGRILFMAVAMGLFLWLVMRLRTPRELTPRTTCRRCGYDVRETPDRCPKCGASVPDERRLRIDLLNGNPPRYLLDEDHALPLREPEPGESFRPLAIFTSRAQYDHLLTLLSRAGIAVDAELQLAPLHTLDVLRLRPRAPHEPRFGVSVPAGDFAVATELSDYVRRQHDASG